MPGTFSNLSVHLVFSTKDRAPLMSRETRERVFPYIGGIVSGQGGTIIAVGGMPDHVHIVARLPACVCVADFVRTIKANSSRMMNHHRAEMRFGWQRGYGAFSVSQSAVSAVAHCVRNQARHHRSFSFRDELTILLTKHGIDFDARFFC